MDFNDLIVRLLGVLRQRWVLFFLMFIAIFAGAVGGAYVVPARFESQATLLITLHAPRVNSTQADQQQVRANLQPEEIMAAQVEIMQAREVTEQLVDELPEWVFVSPPSDKWYVRLILEPLKEAVDAVKALLERARLIEPENERYSRIKMIEKGLTVFPVRKAQVIEISFSAKNPETPPLVVSELIRIYRERAEQLRSNVEGFELYHERALELSEALAVAERERAEFMLANDVIDLESEKQQLLSRLQTERRKADEERLLTLLQLEPRLNQLNRNVGVLSESYFVYRKAADDRETFFERDGNISALLIDGPSIVYQKYTRSRLVLVLFGFAGALFLSLLIVLLVEWISSIRRVYGGNGTLEFRSQTKLKAAE